MEAGETIRQQILDRILERHHLTQDQYELLAKYVALSNKLESASVFADRHPETNPAVDQIAADQKEILEKIKQDPTLEKAQKEYSQSVTESRYENEP